VPFKPFDPLTDTLTPYPKDEELDAMADISEQFSVWDASWSPDLESIKAKVDAAAKVHKAYGATFFANSFTTLNLHGSRITHIDAGFLSLANLTSLSLSHNRISRIENLPTSLLSLDVSYNDISALPSSMPVPLKLLSFAFNKVSSLDPLAKWFTAPRRSLVTLDCAFNDLPSLWNLRVLEGFSNLR
jgi:Leucine-rich repeat (LRR) protein